MFGFYLFIEITISFKLRCNFFSAVLGCWRFPVNLRIPYAFSFSQMHSFSIFIYNQRMKFIFWSMRLLVMRLCNALELTMRKWTHNKNEFRKYFFPFKMVFRMKGNNKMLTMPLTLAYSGSVKLCKFLHQSFCRA